MKPVDQSKFGKEGDCVRACLASYFELELTDVPEIPTSSSFEQWSAFDDFVESRGLERSYVPGLHGEVYFVSGLTARGLYHLVLMQDYRLLHDPHPSRAGLIKAEYTFRLQKLRVT